MTHNLGTELTEMGSWADLPDIDRRVTKVLLSGSMIQLLTECEATTTLLQETDAHQANQLKELFAHLKEGDKRYDYDTAVAWMAFSYTCAYTDELTKSAGGDDAAFLARKTALAKVIPNRDSLLQTLIDNRGVLFAATDKRVKDLCKLDVLKGVGTPTAGAILRNLNDLSDRLHAAKWEAIAEGDWLNLRGNQYRALRYDMTDLDFRVDGLKIVKAEALLDPGFVQKTVLHCRVTLEDGSHRKQAGGDFVHRITNLRYGFAGNKCEYDTANMAPSLAGDAHWQDKVADWRLGTGGNRENYYGQVHPKITQYLLSLLPFAPTPDHVTVLDIAGGNGDLAERIIQELAAAPFHDVKLTYILVDYSKADVDIATKRFQAMKLPSTFRVRTTALHRDMLSYNYDAGAARQDLGVPQGADIIVNSGGLLNNQIGDNNQTPARFNQMYAQMLKPGGYGVYSGLTPLLVNAATHQAHGLNVVNLYDPEVDRQMHVVQRPK